MPRRRNGIRNEKTAKFIAKLAVQQSAIQSVSEHVYPNGHWSV
jgi:hypothetical protein